VKSQLTRRQKNLVDPQEQRAFLHLNHWLARPTEEHLDWPLEDELIGVFVSPRQRDLESSVADRQNQIPIVRKVEKRLTLVRHLIRLVVRFAQLPVKLANLDPILRDAVKERRALR